MRARRLWLAVAIPYLLSLRSTCHDPSFMPHYPSPFCEPTTIHLCHRPVLSFTLTGSHRQMCPCLGKMLSLVLSIGCECMVSSVHKARFDDEFFVQPPVIYRTVLQKCQLIWQWPKYCACLLLLSIAFAGVITHSTSVQGSIYQLS